MNQTTFEILLKHGVKLANEMLAQQRQELNNLCQEASKAFTATMKANGHVFAVDDSLDSNCIEGSLVEPITNESRLIDDSTTTNNTPRLFR